MKNQSRRITRLAALAGWLMLGGCSVLAPQPDPSRFFTLSLMPDAAQAGQPANGTGGAAEPTYALGPVTLPAYLDRNEIATRVGATQIVYSQTDRWAEPLTTEVARTLLLNLSALLGPERIVSWPGRVAVDRQIEVAVLRFERVDSGASQLMARWSVKDMRSGRLLMLKESTFTHASPSPAAADTVNALSADLADFSQEIAQQLALKLRFGVRFWGIDGGKTYAEGVPRHSPGLPPLAATLG